MKDNYSTEARERYGGTAAYREHEQKTKNYTKEKWADAIAVYCQEKPHD